MHDLPSGSGAPTRSWAPPIAAVYAFTFAGVLVATYLPRHFEAIGLSSAAIGTLFSARALLQSAVTPVWGGLADRHGATRRLVQVQLAVGVGALLVLPFTASYPLLFAALVLNAVTAGCSTPLVDTLTLREVGAARFGTLRAWGSVGYGLLAIIAAAAGLAATHEQLAGYAPWALVVLAALTLGAALRFPPGRARVSSPRPGQVLRLLGRPALLLVLPIAALHWATISPYNLFLVFLCEQRGLGAWVPGAAVTAGIVCEVAVLALGSRLLSRFGAYPLLVGCVGITAVRWGLSGVVTDPAPLIGLQALHGLSFGGFYVALMAILAEEVAPEIRATGQAVLYFVVFGMGGALGNFLSGLVLEHRGAPTLFVWAGLVEAVVFVLALLAAGRLASRTDGHVT